jgi:8-oxo-dGTP pyrophosphatase MutT (NUDIX family)/nucleoside 2-deoxyribosyltransferase
MKTIYYYDEPPKSFSKSIFLAGPSPRNHETKSWRPEALSLLERKGFDGIVFVPEPKKRDDFQPIWPKTAEWEHNMIDISDIILFWVPRDLSLSADNEPKLPAFTTNVEFGHWANSGKAVFGFPPESRKNRYLKFMADKFYVPTFDNLEDTVDKALKIIGDGAFRSDGERDIPLHIWRMRAFQNWYKSQKMAGNRLDGAKIEWISRVRNKPEILFAFAMRPDIYVTSEHRNKFNDPVISRLDISSVVLYKKDRDDIFNSKIVMIKEFRSSASTEDGFIWELPGGSSGHITDPLEIAVEEVREEVGIEIDKRRLKYVGSRQLAGTLSSHKSHTYSAELTDNEFAWLKTQKDIPHGSDYPHNQTGERAYTEILTLRNICGNNLLDWSNIGMIFSALSKGV